MLEVDNLCVSFSGLQAVSDLSFTLEPGTILAMIGPNGAGKSTVFNAVSGFVKPASGTIRFDGRIIGGLPPHRIAARGIQRTFQNNGLLKEMTVAENVLTGLALSTASSLVGVVFNLPGSLRAEREALTRTHHVLDRMGLAGLAARVVGNLSFGQQRMVEISRAMVAGARMIMLDEPAVGLSPGERNILGQSIRKLAADGVGILLVEHVQELVMAVSDRIMVLHHGCKIAEGTPGEIRQNQAVLNAYLGCA
jgi:branched-chain amino acid transport system ATP-binding protein